MVEQVKKRNGEIVIFDAKKIREAIHKANIAVADEKIPAKSLRELTDKVVGSLPAGQVPTVEQIQDKVEEILIGADYAKTAKAYILYRAEHAKIRQSEADLMDIYKELTFAYAKDADIKRENANIDADTAMGTMLKYGSEGSKYFIDNYILPKDIAAAHINGDIHIHDKDFYMLTETCCQIDLLKLFHNGFSTGHGTLREPNSIQSYSALACIAIQANQNEMHGGQSVPNFDYSMAPGVAKTFIKEYFRALAAYFHIRLGLSMPDAKALADRVREDIPLTVSMREADAYKDALKAWLPAHQREGGFQDITSEQAGEAHDFAADTAWYETDRATYQAMEAFIHNLNTMNSRAGAQVPFSSVNYGTDTSPEARMVVRNLLEATDAGLGDGETPIFPVQIFKVKEGVNFNPGDPNYDLFKLAIKTSAKRLFPNFSFIDSPFNLQYYKPGHPETEVSYMGCRTRVMGNVYDPSQEIANGRGNLSFTSINLPRLAIESHGDEALFYEKLKDMMELVIGQLDDRFAIQSKKRVYNFPFLMGQGVWLDSEKLGPSDEVGEVLKHGTLSIGFIGLAETLISLYGHHHGESDAMQEKGLAIVQYMRRYLDARSERTHMNYSLLATPAEGLSGRFVRMDKKRYGLIPGVTDKDYYTNSFHIPVYYNISAYEKIRKEAPYHALTNAGHISYVELDGDTANNLEAFESIVRCMHDCGIGYGSINHPVDRDPICGYVGVIGEVCPRCGRREGEAVSPERIKELRKLYPGTFTYCGCE